MGAVPARLNGNISERDHSLNWGGPNAREDIEKRRRGESHAALDAILKGDKSGYQALFSECEDVRLAIFGPFARGRRNVEAALSAPHRIIVMEE